MSKKLLLVFSFFIVIFALTILAQEDQSVVSQQESNTDVNVELDENIQASDLDIEEPTLLPDSPFYFLKSIKRAVQSAFSFNSVKKAELKLRFANEKLIEAKKLALENPDEFGEAIESYKEEMEKLKNSVEKIKETIDSPKVQGLLDKFVDNTLKHQRLFGKLAREIPSDLKEKIAEVKEKQVEKFSEIALKLSSPEKLGEKIAQKIDQVQGSDFKYIKHLEVLQEIKEKVPENAKEAIEKVIERSVEKMQEKLEQMPKEKQELLSEYLENVGSDENKRLEIVEKLTTKVPQEIKQDILQTKDRIKSKIEEKNQEETVIPEKAKEQLQKAKELLGEVEDIFSALTEELKEKIEAGKSYSYSKLFRDAKSHIEKAENAQIEENWGEVWGQSNSALQILENIKKIIENKKTSEKLKNCPISNFYPHPESCPNGKWIQKSDEKGCPKYICQKFESIAK